nr:hypothetical protein MACL_00002512 [Theileria orientalis]
MECFYGLLYFDCNFLIALYEVEQQHINFQAEVPRPTQPPVNLVPPADKSLITLDLQVLSDDRYEISYSENKVLLH